MFPIVPASSAGGNPFAWTIRGFQPGDERPLVELFERAFGKTISESHWRWKLKGLPTSVENVWLAVADQQPIFQYAGVPAPFSIDGQDVQAMVSVDTMTDPAFRRRGLLTTVAGNVYDIWSGAGIPFVLGLPNEQWGSRAAALGWQPLTELRWFVRPIDVGLWLSDRPGMSWLPRAKPFSRLFEALFDRTPVRPADMDICTLAQTTAALDDFWNTCRQLAGASVRRDRSWVDWRFFQAPDASYTVLASTRDRRLQGYVAYRLTEDRGHTVGAIAELVTLPGDELVSRLLIAEVVKRCRSAGATKMVALAVPGSPTHAALAAQGFFAAKHGFSVQIVVLEAGRRTSALIDPHKWTLTGAEFDVL